MDRSPVRKGRTSAYQDALSQPTKSRRKHNTFLSQPSTSTSLYDSESQCSQDNTYEEEAHSRNIRKSLPGNGVSQEEGQLVNNLTRYLLAMDRSKQAINKARIIKNVFGNQGRRFNPVLIKTKNILSKIFGYKLLELEGNKYMLVNEIQNDTPHIKYSKRERSWQVLLFIVLTHIFMQGESCTEESLWDFLAHLGIINSNVNQHDYFGNVKHIITEDFVNQRYLDKVILENSDPPQIEFKWGVRAENEFSRRAALEFVSQVYNGRAINSWLLQFKTMTAREKASR